MFRFPLVEEVPHSNSVLILVVFLSFPTTYSCCADILVERGKLRPLPNSTAPTQACFCTWADRVEFSCLSSSGGENMVLCLL